MRRSLYRQIEHSLDIWSSKVTAASIQAPKSFTTGEGLMFSPNRMTGGKDKFCVSCGTPLCDLAEITVEVRNGISDVGRRKC